jgi:SnoaL-like protein
VNVDDENAALLEVLALPDRAPTSIEERVADLEDRQQIRDLVLRYAYLCDAREWDELLELYTDDIERVLAGTLVEQVRGKAELRERLVSPVLARKGETPGAPPPDKLATYSLRHLIADDVVRIADDGEHATAAVAYTLVAIDPVDRRRGAHEGAYVFSFRKDEGRWRFCRQVIFSNSAHNPLFQG